MIWIFKNSSEGHTRIKKKKKDVCFLFFYQSELNVKTVVITKYFRKNIFVKKGKNTIFNLLFKYEFKCK